MKKILSLVIAIFTLLGAFGFTLTADDFKDVTDGKWYTDGIRFCAANGYMSGISDTQFDRNTALTRAMFMTVLSKIDKADLTEYEGKSSFSDVKTDGWYTSAIEWAYQNKLASGIGGQVFGYKNPVTREQMALFLYAYAEYVNAKTLPEVEPMPEPPVDGTAEDMPEESDGLDESYPIDTTPRADLSVFKDADRIHDWAKDAMEWAVACELFSGIGEGYLDPRGSCTRAQAAVLIRAFVLGFLSDCEHEWIEPTCTESGYCKRCKMPSSLKLGHYYGPNYRCDVSYNCQRCGQASVVKKHVEGEYGCLSGSRCTVCGIRIRYGKGFHQYRYGYCEVCENEQFPGNAYNIFFKKLREQGERRSSYDDTGFNYEGNLGDFKLTYSMYFATYSYIYGGGMQIYHHTIDSQQTVSYDTRITLKSREDDLYSYIVYCPLGPIEGTFTPDIINSFTLNPASFDTPDNRELIMKEVLVTLSFTEKILNDNTDLSLADIGFDLSDFDRG